ncbi:MAG TPA: TolC family protein [Flavobacterium sp.]|uniref:TolC family protein n=1 Tax=unclassified Flavobacterium TaxID=196869 RepID=UPI000E8EEF1E|nr:MULTISPECIES: TolC family protein [unclassified Flavobacterium]HBI00676.1 transporter [Flavobacterium sp.]HRE77621.1 TolC family protein [Flavobacterium sp.]
MKKLSLFLLLACLGMQAQETKKSYSFSLQQAIDHALQYNYTAINSGRDIEAAKKKKWETTAAGLPQINAGLDYANNFKLQTQAVSGNLFDPDGDPNQISTFAFGTKHSMVARSTLSQLIFDGSYIVALQASKTYLQYYESSKKKTDLEIREMIINSYGNVLLAEENIAILEKNKATLDKTLFDTEQTFKNGLIEEENVEQLKITLSSINSSLNYTKRLKDISYNMLKINLGIELEEDLSLTDKLENLTASNLDMALTGSSFEVKNSIDYALSTNFVEQRTLEMKLEKSKFLPSLSANLNFGYNAFGDQFEFFTQNQRWFNYSNLGVGLNVPIFSSFGKNAKVQQSKIALEQAQTQLTETEQRLKLQYQNAKSDYEYSVEQYFSSKENLSLAERIEKKQQVKFTEGISTSFDFTDAQRQLYSAQQSYLQSMVDVISRKAALEKAIGQTK